MDFADGCVKSLEVVQQKSFRIQQIISEWFAANRLLLNTEKIQVVFSLSDLGDVNNVEKVKFLGVWIDPLLKWNTHIESLCDRMRKSVFAKFDKQRNIFWNI